MMASATFAVAPCSEIVIMSRPASSNLPEVLAQRRRVRGDSRESPLAVSVCDECKDLLVQERLCVLADEMG